MPTHTGNARITPSNSAPATTETTRWPAFGSKSEALSALAQVTPSSPSLADAIMRLSNSDPTSWADRGSVAR
jgi:hypothetical protein